MPELTEDMYCSQQICIPPSFPYLLRQYAKAAIRTQPGDLLRWSTAYFRCLALNVPPPVKPRLEYPIPKSHFGLTPGWLRALMYQLQNNLTVTYKILWDRWIGACLQHINLIQVLCLGGFTDPWAVPWFRFVALCAAHLTDNLTQTMVLVCEVLTEEPEGGSAMIPLEVFTDVYRYLASIDASEGRYMRNLYFVDSLLSLYREPVVEEAKESTIELEEVVEEEIVEPEEEKEEVVEQGPVEDLVGVVISCPDIAADDYKTEEDFVIQTPVEPSMQTQPSQTTKASSIKEKESSASKKTTTTTVTTGTAGTEQEVPVTDSEAAEEAASTAKSESPSKATTPTAQPEEDKKSVKTPGGAAEGDVKPTGSVDTLIDYMPPRQRDLELLEDLAKVKAAQMGDEGEEYVGEEEEAVPDYELDKLRLLLEGPSGPGTVESEPSVSMETEEQKEEIEEAEEEEEKGELVWVEAVPGIGPEVSLLLVEAVEKYMKECAKIQQGMVMPRNIRHYNCPPLEALNRCPCKLKTCKHN